MMAAYHKRLRSWYLNRSGCSCSVVWAQLCEKWFDAEPIPAITNYMASSHGLGTSALCLTSVLPIKLLSVLQYISMMRAVNALGKSPPAALGLVFLC